MNRLAILVMTGSAMLFSGSAMSQTCASPGEIKSFHGSEKPALTGTTCGGEQGVDLGGVPLVHPTAVYSFVAEGANGQIRTSGDATISALISEGCNQAPMAAGNVIDLDALNLVDGQTYYVFFTSENIGVPEPQICGNYSVETDLLPVTLQDFSVE